MSLVYQTTVTVAPWDTDSHGMLRLSEALHYTQQVAGQHCDQLGLPQQFMDEKGLFWAIIRNQLTIHRLPKAGDSIRLETWPMPTTRTCYPRSMAAYDEKGQVLFRLHSLWVLMDVNTRAMVLPGKSGVRVEGILRGTELPTPASLIPREMERKTTRTVCYSDLDRNGHMNNVKYLDWSADLLPSSFHREHPPKNISLCYVSEAREGAELSMNWTHSEDNVLRVEATDTETGKRIFGAEMVCG